MIFKTSMGFRSKPKIINTNWVGVPMYIKSFSFILFIENILMKLIMQYHDTQTLNTSHYMAV